jgi:hypothetical protein
VGAIRISGIVEGGVNLRLYRPARLLYGRALVIAADRKDDVAIIIIAHDLTVIALSLTV